MGLLAHQQEALWRVVGHDNVAFYHDMGMGKTFTGAQKLVLYGCRTNLVICQKSKITDWVNHFRQHYPTAHTFDLTNAKQLDQFMGKISSGRFWCIGVVNYERAWRRPELEHLLHFTLMLDESSLIQNRKAKQSKFILKLRPDHVILLSGTPTAGKYEKLWTQLHLLGWEISEDLYHRQYVNWKTIESDGFIHKVVDMENPYKNVERLKQKLRDHGADFLKTEEVLDLPDQTFTEVMISTSKEYRKFWKTGYVQLKDGGELIGDQVFSKRLYSRQLCGQYSTAKLEAFRDLLESTNDRVIVFYNFTAELKALKLICDDLGRPVSVINGSTKDLTAYENQTDSVTLIQYQAGAMGLNLQKANKLIYFTLPERSDLFEQSKARIHRIGQEKPCFYWILMCEGSVETKIYETLKLRRDFTDELFEEC